VDKLPLGAIGIYNVADKIKVGLQQLMAGSRSWGVPYISRRDLAALTEECARITLWHSLHHGRLPAGSPGNHRCLSP
jgi:hypothetical protein